LAVVASRGFESSTGHGSRGRGEERAGSQESFETAQYFSLLQDFSLFDPVVYLLPRIEITRKSPIDYFSMFQTKLSTINSDIMNIFLSFSCNEQSTENS
jgi:hypothetical protein